MSQLIAKVSVSQTLDSFNKQKSIDVPVALSSLGPPGSFSFDDLQFCSTCLGINLINEVSSTPKNVVEVKRVEYMFNSDIVDVGESTPEAPLWVSVERSRPIIPANDRFKGHLSGSQSEDLFAHTETAKRNSNTKKLKRILSTSMSGRNNKNK